MQSIPHKASLRWLASLCPSQTPHIRVCSSNVEEMEGDVGWEGEGKESRGVPIHQGDISLESGVSSGVGERQPPRSQPHGTVVLWERLRDRAETAQWARMPAGGLLIPKVSPNYRDP